MSESLDESRVCREGGMESRWTVFGTGSLGAGVRPRSPRSRARRNQRWSGGVESAQKSKIAEMVSMEPDSRREFVANSRKRLRPIESFFQDGSVWSLSKVGQRLSLRDAMAIGQAAGFSISALRTWRKRTLLLGFGSFGREERSWRRTGAERSCARARRRSSSSGSCTARAVPTRRAWALTRGEVSVMERMICCASRVPAASSLEKAVRRLDSSGAELSAFCNSAEADAARLGCGHRGESARIDARRGAVERTGR